MCHIPTVDALTLQAQLAHQLRVGQLPANHPTKVLHDFHLNQALKKRQEPQLLLQPDYGIPTAVHTATCVLPVVCYDRSLTPLLPGPPPAQHPRPASRLRAQPVLLEPQRLRPTGALPHRLPSPPLPQGALLVQDGSGRLQARHRPLATRPGRTRRRGSDSTTSPPPHSHPTPQFPTRLPNTPPTTPSRAPRPSPACRPTSLPTPPTRTPSECDAPGCCSAVATPARSGSSSTRDQRQPLLTSTSARTLSATSASCGTPSTTCCSRAPDTDTPASSSPHSCNHSTPPPPPPPPHPRHHPLLLPHRRSPSAGGAGAPESRLWPRPTPAAPHPHHQHLPRPRGRGQGGRRPPSPRHWVAPTTRRLRRIARWRTAAWPSHPSP